jgi:hypothetical protein
MKKDKIIYWTTTGLITLMMLFSAYSYFAVPKVIEGFKQMGYPNYFRIELGLAKIIGSLFLLIPMIPARMKEWAYVGFGIVFISATIAHLSNGDAISMVITPLVFLVLLIVSNIYMYKLNKTVNTESGHS